MTAASEPDYDAIEVPETPTTDEEIAKLPVLDLEAHKASAAPVRLWLLDKLVGVWAWWKFG